jgi:two-component system, chemotaxis family, chemotaxis protein CheY
VPPPLNLKVLVADDSRVVTSLLTSIILRSAFSVEIATEENGRDCMERLAHNDIDLAFIDVHMPEMNGMEALCAARYQGIKSFVTLMSTRGSDVRFQLAKQLKCYDYLIKPFDEPGVQAILQTFGRIKQRTHALIVDDSSSVRKTIRRIMSNSMFRIDCDEAADGKSAIMSYYGKGYDIVFLDYNMPDLNGQETLDQLLKRNRSAKVIMMSAERDDHRVRQALDRGAVDFLYKPFFSEDIDRVLHKAYGLRMPGLASFEPPEEIRHLSIPALERLSAATE